MTTIRNTLLHNLGLLVHVPGLMALASLPVSLLAGETYAAWAFLWTAALALGVGQALVHLCPSPRNTRLRSAMVIAAVGWASVSTIGALPFFLTAFYLADTPAVSESTLVFQQPLNALFESFSGFTSTGLSMALDPAELPYSLQWWRSFSEWVGGVGVIVLMLSVIQSAPGLYRLYYSEGREEKLFPSVGSTVRTIWWIYLLYTVLGVLLLWLAGMHWWAALNHGMAGISTGGFAITANSMGAYGPAAQLVMVLIMLVGAISFAIHFQILTRRNPAVLWKSSQHLLLGILVVGGTVLLFIENWLKGNTASWIDALFQWVSALSTCGFSSVDLQPWSASAKLLLTLAMIMGGAAGSTSGGIKLSRLVILYKGVQWRLQKLRLRPHQLMRYMLDGESISEASVYEQVEAAVVMLVLWIGVLLAAMVVLLHVASPQYTAGTVVFEAASAFANAGLSLGITGPDLHWLGKITLIFCMWAGRLEIVPIAMLLAALLSHEQE